jgi:hypothetical protein
MSTAVFGSGSSNEAEVIARARRKSDSHLANSATFAKDTAFAALHDVWRDCRQKGWDGDDAIAIEQLTYRNAWIFIEALPLGYPLPSLGAEPDGHLTLEWYRDPRWTFSVSVSPEGTLHYSALFGDEDPRGSCPFLGEIPETVVFFIRRVFEP